MRLAFLRNTVVILRRQELQQLFFRHLIKVKHFITCNKPQVFIGSAFLEGVRSPGVKMGPAGMPADEPPYPAGSWTCGAGAARRSPGCKKAMHLPPMQRYLPARTNGIGRRQDMLIFPCPAQTDGYGA